MLRARSSAFPTQLNPRDEEISVLLEGKSAVVYGAGGAVGAAVAKAFAAEGAHVALTGRSIDDLEPIMAQITESGGDASVAVVDAFESEAVERHLP
jgi:NADP-dependent 3-hydroxy acid dehydrogenase YdfG